MPPISEVNRVGHSEEGAVIQSGNVVRLDVPTPFFIRNEVFSTFKRPDYSWNHNENDSNSRMILLVGAVEKNKYGDGGLAEENFLPQKKTTPEYSIGGCPLECPFDINEDFDEALVIDFEPLVFEGLRVPSMYLPLHVNDGKRSIQRVMDQAQPFVSELKLLEGLDSWNPQNTSILAFVDGYAQNSGLMLTGRLGYEKVINIHMMGRHRSNAKIFDMECFRKFHEQNLGMENKPVTTVAHAVYEKLHGEYPSKGKVYLEFVFKEPTNVFELPPEDCLSKIAIKPLPGDANPYMETLWSDILDLERWIDVLAQSTHNTSASVDGTKSFLNSTVFEIAEAKMTPNIQAVQDLLAQEPGADLHSASLSDCSDSLGLVLQRVVKQEREDCDFTDRLWSVLKKCESIDELQDCIQLVFQTVSNKMYRPYVLLNNNTGMAKYLTMAMKGEVGSLLQLRRPDVMVKLLIECGLMKLFKDYNFILAISHLIERGEIDCFTPTITNIPESLWKVKKLHCILEVICLAKERLTLSVNTLEANAKKLLRRFNDSKPFTWEEIYHFDVSSHDIRRVMTGLHPIYYKVKMDSRTLLKRSTTSVVISPENYISYKKNPNEDLNLRQYYVYVMAESGRLE